MREVLPIINATPTTLYEVLREWVAVRENGLRKVGRRGRVYVERWDDPLKIAAQVKGDYEAIMESRRKSRRG